MARTRLGLVLTGGTIGSTSAGEAEVVRLVRGPDAGGLPSWLSGPLAEFGPHQLTVRRPIEKHSEEARPDDWSAVAAACRAMVGGGVEAICILHGSDTMSYAAAALSFGLADLDVPIVLTGSNLPPDAAASDARTNVGAAMTALRELPGGVYLIFAGIPDGDALIHLGTRVRKERAAGTAFVSPNGGPVAVVRNGRVTRLRPWPRPRPPVDVPIAARFDARVLELRVHPGLPFAAMEAAYVAGDLHGVVTELYPCATGPTGDDDTSLERFARFVTDRGGIVVGTVPATPDAGDAPYPSLPTLTSAGIGFLPGVLTSTATVKLMWALAASDGDPVLVRSLMRRTIAGESIVGTAGPSLPAPVRPETAALRGRPVAR